MTAKHKRPFYVFAAVALLCCMVLVAGVRGSRADDGRGPLQAGPPVSDAAPTLTPFPAAPEVISPSGGPPPDGGPGSGATGEPDAIVEDLGGVRVGVDPDRDDVFSFPQSGVATLPPFDLSEPPLTGPGVTPPVEDETRRKGRGHHDGKGKDKDEDEVTQGEGPPPGTEPTPGPEAPSETGTEGEPESVEPSTDPGD